MTRSNYKGPYVSEKLLKKAIDAKKKNVNVIYTRSRNSTITFDFLDFIVYIYNGKTYYPLTVKKNILGYKFGAFSFTKKKAVYKKKKKKK
jgi:small subunit ribosomal protein S19